MNGELSAAVWAELLKVRRSVVPWVTVTAFLVAGLVGGFFMFVLQDPPRARSLGLLGAKAQFTGGTADWSGYLALVAQIVAVGGHLVFGMVLIWLFGREFSDRTAKDLLALPTSRATVVLAKFVVALGWCLLLVCQVLVISLVIGAVLRLPGWSRATVVNGSGVIFAAGLLTATLTTTYALVASWGRGYLAAVAAMFLTVFATQVISALGHGAWFPWAVPSLLSGVAGPDQSSPSVPAIASVAMVGWAAGSATVLWWQRADHDR